MDAICGGIWWHAPAGAGACRLKLSVRIRPEDTLLDVEV